MQQGETAIERFACEYTSQQTYYTDKIMTNPQWTMAGIFADGPVKIGLNQQHPTARGALV